MKENYWLVLFAQTLKEVEVCWNLVIIKRITIYTLTVITIIAFYFFVIKLHPCCNVLDRFSSVLVQSRWHMIVHTRYMGCDATDVILHWTMLMKFELQHANHSRNSLWKCCKPMKCESCLQTAHLCFLFTLSFPFLPHELIYNQKFNKACEFVSLPEYPLQW